ncbi:hypothetical protein CTAYLR_008953 [Chrysophaeum taylorii]|uniref:EamA domain-containing protein n=1 Tax=Chrysophaeum taylorii TaxID=2483200 RepID=A0AAD7UMZ4_9STRA|nr:hypothetical protein CTAYLR_008953 [Chrysophaeum taylorii]
MVWPSGEASMVACTVIYAFQALVAKIVERRITALELVTYRSVLAGLASLRVLLKTRRIGRLDERMFGPRDVRHLVVLRGVVGSAAFVVLYVALHMIGVGEHTAILFTNPIWITLLSPVLGEKLTVASCVSILCGAVGALLVSQPFNDRHNTKTHDVGALLALLGAFLVAATMVVVRVVGPRAPALCLAMSFHLFSAAIGSNALAFGIQQPTLVADFRNAFLVVLVSFTSFVGQPLLNHSFQHLPAMRAASLNYLQLLWAFGLGIIFNRERPEIPQFVGAALITSGGLAAASTRRTSSRDDEEEEDTPAPPSPQLAPLEDGTTLLEDANDLERDASSAGGASSSSGSGPPPEKLSQPSSHEVDRGSSI